jgi:hypothetical protein
VLTGATVLSMVLLPVLAYASFDLYRKVFPLLENGGK